MQDLRQQYTAAESALNENVKLKQLLQYESGPSFPKDFHPVNASVIARAPTDVQQQIVISAGSDQGIRKDDPVVTADGLVGKITAGLLERVARDAAHRRNERSRGPRPEQRRVRARAARRGRRRAARPRPRSEDARS